MEILTILMIKSDIEGSISAYVQNEDRVNVYIDAKTKEEANEYLDQVEDAAEEAIRNWTTEPEVFPEETEEEENDYITYPIRKQRLEEIKAEASRSPEGRRFINGLKASYEFCKKHDTTGGLTLEQFRYLAALSYIDIWEGLSNMYNYAFRRGFKLGKKKV